MPADFHANPISNKALRAEGQFSPHPQSRDRATTKKEGHFCPSSSHLVKRSA
jgi:hypothetical protein